MSVLHCQLGRPPSRVLVATTESGSAWRHSARPRWISMPRSAFARPQCEGSVWSEVVDSLAPISVQPSRCVTPPQPPSIPPVLPSPPPQFSSLSHLSVLLHPVCELSILTSLVATQATAICQLFAPIAPPRPVSTVWAAIAPTNLLRSQPENQQQPCSSAPWHRSPRTRPRARMATPRLAARLPPATALAAVTPRPSSPLRPSRPSTRT